MNRTLAGPTSTASATPTAATTTAAIDASRSCRESSEPWTSATPTIGAPTATAMPSGRTAPATIASTLIMRAAANRYGRRQRAAPRSPTMIAGSRTPASTSPGPIVGASATLTTAPMNAITGPPMSATRSHACSRDGNRDSGWIRADAARKRDTVRSDPSSVSRNHRPTPTGHATEPRQSISFDTERRVSNMVKSPTCPSLRPSRRQRPTGNAIGAGAPACPTPIGRSCGPSASSWPSRA